MQGRTHQRVIGNSLTPSRDFPLWGSVSSVANGFAEVKKYVRGIAENGLKVALLK